MFGIVVLLAHGSAAAYQLTTLASFPGGELGAPSGALAYDGTYLYGTTQGPYPGVGTVFRVGVDGSGLSAIHYMDYPSGGFNPYGGVAVVNSQIFGVTFRGGPATGSTIGDGTVFSLNLDGTNHQILRTFGNAATPSGRPHETVTSDGSTIFGTTTGQTYLEYGSIYSINPDGSNFQFLHKFNGADGSYPVTRLQLIGGKLYGATAGFAVFGFNGGTIFSIDTDGTDFQLLHAFGNSEGIHCEGDLALVGSTLYGVTTDGGATGGGTIFRVNLDGGGFQTIHSFPADSAPQSGLTLVDGMLYGTTTLGGNADYGTLFSINPSGTQFETIHSFDGPSGIYPTTRLLAIGSTLYGSTERGGTTGLGTIFAIMIPEPSSIFLLAFAGFALSNRRHRRVPLALPVLV